MIKTLIIPILTLAVLLTGCGSNVLAVDNSEPNTQKPAIQKREEVKQKIASKTAQIKESALDRLKQKASREIDKRINTLNNLLDKMGLAKRLNDDDKSELSVQINDEIAGLETLRDKIEADSSLASLRADVQSIVKDYRVYKLIVPKARMLIASDRILAAAEKFETSVIARLENALNESKNRGDDVSELEEKLEELKGNIESAKINAQKANDLVSELTPDDYNSNPKVFEEPRELLKDGKEDLKDAADKAREVYKSLSSDLRERIKSLRPSRPSTPSSEED